MKAIVLAGGSGTRLWPVSQEDQPKQLQALIGNTSLLRATVDRLRPLLADADIVVMTGQREGHAVRDALQDTEVCVVVEPMRKNTLAAIATACVLTVRTEPDASFVVINSDAHVQDEDAYRAAITQLERVVRARPETLVMVGVTPEYPETAYGYLRGGDALEVDGISVRAIRSFKEKPDRALAEQYVADGDYYWNPTMVAGTCRYLLSLVQRFEPEMYKGIDLIRKAEDPMAVLEAAFAMMPNQCINYGILEREKNMLVLPAHFGWTDIGNWRTVHERSSQDIHENVVHGDVLLHDVHNSLVRNDTSRRVAVVGLDDVIVVQTERATLVVHKDRAQDVREIVKHLS